MSDLRWYAAHRDGKELALPSGASRYAQFSRTFESDGPSRCLRTHKTTHAAASVLLTELTAGPEVSAWLFPLRCTMNRRERRRLLDTVAELSPEARDRKLPECV